jgi:hypothetical protein
MTARAAAQTSDRRSPLQFSLAVGPVEDSYLGVGSNMSAHSLLSVGFAPNGVPFEARLDGMGGPGPFYTLNASVIVPMFRLRLGGRPWRPYALAGVGSQGFRQRDPSGGHFGVGVRVDSTRVGFFAELRRHSLYAQSFLSLGVLVRP